MENGMIRLDWRKLRIDRSSLQRIVQIGAPAALQSAVFSISNICLQAAVNGFGSSAVAGMTAALNFEYLGYFIVSAFAQTVVTFIGQNYGIEYAMARFLYAMPFLFLTATYEVSGSALRGMGRLTLPVVFR